MGRTHARYGASGSLCLSPFVLLGLIAWTAVAPVRAQTPSELGIQLPAVLTITGDVGAVCSIEYATELSPTGAAANWRCLEFLQLPSSPYPWTDQSALPTGTRFYRTVLGPAPADMVFIPSGTFRMGSPTDEVDRLDNEGPLTTVTISRGFFIGKHEVTQAEYAAVTGSNPSTFTSDPSLPVENVDWHEATNYCALLTAREQAAGRIATYCVYRLPTEAEWEYACRAGTTTRFSFGDDPGYASLSSYAWFDSNSAGSTHPAGLKSANPRGLHDMHGNVWEWCLDWWSGSLPGGTVADPQGPPTGSYRVFRGGSWFSGARSCRSASRGSFSPNSSGFSIGFRVVLAAG